MRPAGSIRAALREVVQPGTLMTWREMAQKLNERHVVNVQAPSELRLVQETVKNMVKAGELNPEDEIRVDGSKRPMTRYARAAASNAGHFELAAVFRSLVAA